jgi:rhomboid protease GluP
MSAFIRDFLVPRKDTPETRHIQQQVNLETFYRQVENSKYIPLMKHVFLGFCLLMWLGGIILINAKIIDVEDVTISEGKLTISGMILANFMHFSWLHILMNMTAMIFLFNRFFFANYKILLALIVLSAIGSTLLSIEMMPKDGVLIGASGILYGVLTFYFLYLNDLRQCYVAPEANKKIGKFLLIQTSICVIINFMPMIGWYAHLGGAIMGLILYFVVRKQLDFSDKCLTLTYYKI